MHVITGGTTDNIEFSCMYDASLISSQNMEKDGLFGFYDIDVSLNDAPSILWLDENMKYVKGELLYKCVNCEHCGKSSTGFFNECLSHGFHIDDALEHSCEDQGEKRMIYFISDMHLGHEAAIRMCDRPFKNADEMNDVIIRNINEAVKGNDTLYILGDVSHRISVAKANELIGRIKCKNLILIKGNHDRIYDSSLFKEVCDFKEIYIPYKDKTVSISLMHYPMEQWPKSFYGSFHFHGHCHNKPEYNLRMRDNGIRRYDVGVDANNFKPVSVYDVLSFFEF